MFVIVSVVMMVMAVTFRLQYIAVQDQQALWRSTDVNQYTLMMGNGSSEYPMTVETLFGMAYHCVMICDVQFHPEYGFPINMSGFLIFKDISGPLLTDVHMRFVAFDIQ